VCVAGRTARLGDRALPADQITIDGKVASLLAEQPARVLVYHKPVGELVTRSDPEGRPTVFSRLPPGRWVAVGRLDINSSGLLLLTDSGELANRLMHPRYEIEREYAVRVQGRLNREDLEKLARGVHLDDGPAGFERIAPADERTAPSANRFTQLSPTTADHVRQGLGSDVDLILDGGPCEVGIESTVLSLAGPQAVLLRPGAISRTEIEALIGSVTTAEEISTGAHSSPGMHRRHYSPRTPLLLVEGGKVPERGSGVYLQHQHPPSRSDVTVVQMPTIAAKYAAVLYKQLHQSDDARLDWIRSSRVENTVELKFNSLGIGCRAQVEGI